MTVRHKASRLGEIVWIAILDKKESIALSKVYKWRNCYHKFMQTRLTHISFLVFLFYAYDRFLWSLEMFICMFLTSLILIPELLVFISFKVVLKEDKEVCFIKTRSHTTEATKNFVDYAERQALNIRFDLTILNCM